MCPFSYQTYTGRQPSSLSIDVKFSCLEIHPAMLAQTYKLGRYPIYSVAISFSISGTDIFYCFLSVADSKSTERSL